MLLQNILLFALAGFFLVISGIYLVKSLERISKFLRISEFTAAFILMAFATSLPELLVGINSAIQGSPAISMGNVIGASILDLTLITGLFILLSRGIKFKTKKVGSEIYFMFASIVLLLILYLVGNSLSRIDGIILVGLFGINSYRIFKKREDYPSEIKDTSKRYQGVLFTAIFIGSLLLLFFASAAAVKYAKLIAIDFNFSELIVGIFLVSIATTLPELIFGINAVLKKHPEMAIGNQTGTIFTNIALILGVVAIIHPITVAQMPFFISGLFMLLSAFLFVVFIQSERKIDIFEGISLIFLYLFFIILQFFAIPRI
ncbi:sodium:calcium antiporter [archaeon]|jgi:cation:H+ antiporter|nr:sodium:calcium antiporter [archaeon]MBT4373329.1 sodium:calcium antiporter [archaeon]MBT4531674.1 sodium:calcium antiporter [archaeon]MBT7001148.1 sodium:calcium antiporter [archaeon]MBT7282366.1 sodium:calcium antiporter [archaeon]